MERSLKYHYKYICHEADEDSYTARTILIESPCPRDLKDERHQLDDGVNRDGEVRENG